MDDRFDVIVVGARCAGSPLAALLAGRGVRTCLVDRARFPSDTASTHAVQPAGVRILRTLGVLDPLLEVTPAVENATIAFDDDRAEFRGFTRLVGAPMVGARRTVLDPLLVDAAAAAGADVRTQEAVTGLVEEGGRVAGVRTGSGTLRAPLVVGADGVTSTVARLVGAADYHVTPPGRLFTWSYFEGADAAEDHMRIGSIGDRGFLAFPCDAGLFMVAAVPSIHRRDEVLADREAAYRADLAYWPELESAVAGATRVGPIRVLARECFFRESAGPGWALVGDAGHFKDPTPGQGIADALRQAVELAAAVERALGDGPQATDRALRDWWAWRDRDAWEMYWFARDLAAPGPPPLLMQEVMARIAADPALTEGLAHVLNHDVPPSRVFTPRLALSAALGALRRRRGQRRAILREAVTLAAENWRLRAPLPPSPAAKGAHRPVAGQRL